MGCLGAAGAAEPVEQTTEAGKREGAVRGHRRGRLVRGRGGLQSAVQCSNVPAPERLLVLLVEALAHAVPAASAAPIARPGSPRSPSTSRRRAFWTRALSRRSPRTEGQARDGGNAGRVWPVAGGRGKPHGRSLTGCHEGKRVED